MSQNSQNPTNSSKPKFDTVNAPISEMPQRAVVKIEEHKRWIEDNPGKFDGVLERYREIALLEQDLDKLTKK